jgi:hypothetical protein
MMTRAMFDPQMMLLSTFLQALVAELESDPAADRAWEKARAHVKAADEEAEPELQAALDAKDVEALKGIVTGWASGERLLIVHDRGVLKRAMKAYRKSLKVTRLDAESKIGGSPMSTGRESAIAGIRPPERYPREVWDELARQERLADVKHGLYELGPKA